MERAQNEIELGQRHGIHIAFAFRREVHLDGAKCTDTRACSAEFLVEKIDLPTLSRESLLVHSSRDLQPLRMVRDGHVFIAEGGAGLNHLANPNASVAMRGVHLEVGPESRSPLGMGVNRRTDLREREESAADLDRLGDVPWVLPTRGDGGGPPPPPPP